MSSQFDDLLRVAQDQRLPPVQQWQPDREGSIDIRIAADGRWFHEGAVIPRATMTALFASILRKDPQGYALVTPVERLAIVVEDVPFIAVDMHCGGAPTQPELLFSTNVDDHVLLGPGHALSLQGSLLQPYIEVRDGLLARLSRPLYYRLVDFCLDRQWTAENRLYVQSQGEKYDLGSLV